MVGTRGFRNRERTFVVSLEYLGNALKFSQGDIKSKAQVGLTVGFLGYRYGKLRR